MRYYVDGLYRIIDVVKVEKRMIVHARRKKNKIKLAFPIMLFVFSIF